MSSGSRKKQKHFEAASRFEGFEGPRCLTSLSDPVKKHFGAASSKPLLASFEAFEWLAKRTAGQDGRQICNGCKALQGACRYAGRANHRLARLRARAAQNRLHDRLPALPADAVRRHSCPRRSFSTKGSSSC